MSYTLKFSDSTKTTDIVVPAMPPGINTVDTSLSLVGRGYPNYGEKVAENFLHLLENFASSVPPENPIEGQLWYDTSDPNNKVLRIMDGTVSSTRWPSVTGIYQQSTDPKLESTQGLKTGDIWVDTFGNQLKIYSAGNWTLVGPQSTSTNTGAVPEYITDKSGNSHWVIKNYVDNNVVSVISGDSFIPSPSISGFDPNKPLISGINLSLGSIVNGISSSTYNLSIGNSIYPVTAFLRKNNNSRDGELITGKVKFVESDGVVISSSSADSNNIQLYKNLNDAVLINNTAGGKIIFKIKGAGLTDYLSVEQAVVKIGFNTPSNSTTTGALVVTGGVAVGGNLYVGNKLYVNGFNLNTATLSLSNTAVSTSTTTGALTVAGGVGIGGRLNVGSTATIYSTASSTSTTTGALLVSGGVGIGGRLNVGGRIFSGDIITSGFVLAAQNITSSLTLEGKNLEISGTDTSVSTITGAVTVVGGVGIGGKLYVGGLSNNTSSYIVYYNTTTGAFSYGANSGGGGAGGAGPQGPQGPAGSTGAQGPQGVAGPTGPGGGAQGPQGPQGTAGAQGPQGPAGSTGAQGPQGPSGPGVGAQGPQGPAGNTGAQGPQGPAGSTGAQGPQGVAGPTGPGGGDPGAQGPQGPSGNTGAQGPQGPSGNTGAQGPQGPAGNTGPQGPQGPAGSNGAQGPQGVAGPTGPGGGDPGAQGPQGPQGVTGAQGPQGPQGVTGAQGPQGPSGNTGAQGPQGPSGNTGAQGPQGPSGPSTFTQITASTIRTVDAKLKEMYVTPEDFGAVGNGLVDDTAAIQAAIDTGKSVYLPDGKLYYITTSTTSTALGTVISPGVGLRITTNNQRFGGPGAIWAVGNIEAVKVTGDCSGVELDLTFNSPYLSGTAVVVDFANRVSIRKLYGANIGLEVGGSVLYVRQCNQCTVDWIWATAGGAQFTNNTLNYPSGTGITWYGSSATRNGRADRSDILHINFAVINCGGYGLNWDGNCNSLSCSNLGLIATKGVIIQNTSGGSDPGIARFTDLEIDYPTRHGVEILVGLDYDFNVPYIQGAGILYDEWLKNGENYTIIYPGSTNWVAIGAPDNNAGTQFTKTGTTGHSIAGGGFAKVTGTSYSGIKISSSIIDYQVRLQGGKYIGNTGYGIDATGAGVVYSDGTMDLSANQIGKTAGKVWSGVTPTYTVGTLPPGAQGMRAFVTNASTTTFYSAVVVGSPGYYVPVFFDGSDWRIG
jgi:Collagen triple helix repeat (20 copies)